MSADRIDRILDRLSDLHGAQREHSARLDAFEASMRDGLREVRATVEGVRSVQVAHGSAIAAQEQRLSSGERRISSLQRTVGDTTERVQLRALSAAEQREKDAVAAAIHRAQVKQTWRVVAVAGSAALAAAGLVFAALKLAGCA